MIFQNVGVSWKQKTSKNLLVSWKREGGGGGLSNIVEIKEHLDQLARDKKADVDEEAAKALHDVEEAMREIEEDYSKRD